ncbi:MAG: PilT/PilU family type 4a pilus ATPase [Candidatus Absconditabacteria bacterium]|nr:PilT/PilU family type 4a pilus ATPase [Candidatus Absconditabacteria bacterium]MDD3868638.1 PilT/PilU family type 4a pilus ATPase [Candidatus Absconditabacteria bacterium]MDD4714158.1 PilT/PilU family type 4a pilus ATPase [Candidatus Absconditabacteria bacterium]
MQGIGLDIESVLKVIASNQNISDVHLSAGEFVAYRLNGEIVRKEEFGRVGDENMEIILRQLFKNNPQRFDKFLVDKEADFAYVSKDNVAYRVNAFLSTGRIGVVMRKIDSTPRVLEEIMFQNVSETIKKNVLQAHKGLFLVTGPTGSGKSTSIVAMLEEINKEKTYNIITVEDPIEYVFQAQKSLVSQREIGHDTRSFDNAIKSALREDPNVIFVGEIRNMETAEAVLNLAETGHLVFSTLHTNSATYTLNRFISFFPADMQVGIIERVADCLLGVMSQNLVKRKDGQGRIAMFELLLNTNAVKNNLKKREIEQIQNIIETSSQNGMITMKQYAKKLLDRQIIDPKELEGIVSVSNV